MSIDKYLFYLRAKYRILSLSASVSLLYSLDVIEHESAETEAGEAREAHEHVDGGVGVQAPGQQRPHRRADGPEPVDDGGHGGDGLARALEPGPMIR